jgi:putative ABC transport system ATP-binding protein
MTEVPVLEMYGVEKEYPGHPPVRALGGVDLRVDRGELLAIVGPSGSGKSTLLHIMGTLDQPTAGTVRIAGVEVSGLSDRRLSGVRSRLIGFVFQQFHLLDGMSAIENVATGLIYAGMAPSRRRRAARDALERVGLDHRLHHVPSHLSGGERQRVAIARALVHRPEIVLADEPSGNLDTATSESILALLKDLNDEGSTIVVITHDHDLADALPRRVGIRDGLIEFDTVAGVPELSS